MQIEACSHLIKGGNSGGQVLADKSLALLAGLTVIQQVTGLGQPEINQWLGHFRMGLHGQEFVAPGEGLVLTPLIGQ